MNQQRTSDRIGNGPGLLGGFVLALGAILTAILIGSVAHARAGDVSTSHSSAATASTRVCVGGSNRTRVADEIVSREQTELYQVAHDLYTNELKRDPTDSCAAAGLVRLAGAQAKADQEAKTQRSWEQRLDDAWKDWSKTHQSPLQDVLPGVAGLLVLLLVLSRLATRALVAPMTTATSRAHRRAIWVSGLVLVAMAAVAPQAEASATLASHGWIPAAIALATVLGALILLYFRSNVVKAAIPEPMQVVGWGPPVLVISGAFLVAEAYDLVALFVGAKHLGSATLATGALFAVVGVVLLGFGRGLGLGIRVQVVAGRQPDVTTGRLLVGRLETLGSHNPKGMRVAEGSDVSDLPEDALTSVPAGAVAKAIFSVIRVALPAAPWRIEVSLSDDHLATVNLLRNGLALPDRSIVINWASYSALPDPAGPIDAAQDGEAQKAADATANDEVLTGAAAHVLICLKDIHPQLRRGLCGADTWQALAFSAVAQRRETPSERRRWLLDAAIGFSPRYLLARSASVLATDDSTPDGRRRLADALDQLWNEFGVELGASESGEPLGPPMLGYEAIQLRMVFNRAIAWANVATDPSGASNARPLLSPEGAWERATRAALLLDGRLSDGDLKNQNALDKLRTDIGRALAYLIVSLSRSEPSATSLGSEAVDLRQQVAERATELLTVIDSTYKPQRRFDFYARACMYALEQADLDKALTDLEVAAADDRLRAETASDPSFRTFRATSVPGCVPSTAQLKRYKELFTPEPLVSYLDLPPFAAKADQLKAYGLETLRDLDLATATELAVVAKVNRGVAARWVDIARLGALVRVGYDDEDSVVQILQLLLRLEIDSGADLVERMSEREVLFSSLVQEAADLRVLPTRAQTIDVWPSPASV